MARTSTASEKAKKKAKKDALDLAAAQAARETMEANNFNHEFDDQTDDFDTDSDSDGFDDTVSSNEVDIFIDSYNKSQKSNNTAKFSIMKNGETIATKFYPYSWDDIREEYGPGSYKVTARSDNGRYIGSQSQTIGDPRKKPDEEPDSDKSSAQPLGFYEMWQMMKAERESAERESKEQNNNALSSQAKMMEMMMLMSQQSQQQMQTLMTTIMQQNNQNMMQLMTLTAKKDDGHNKGLDPIALQKLLHDAEKAAEERVKFMFQQIETKSEALAEQKAELLAGQYSDEDGEGSTMKQLIKGFIPLIANIGQSVQAAQGLAVQASQNQGQQAPPRIVAPQGLPVQRPQEPRQRPPQQARPVSETKQASVRPGPKVTPLVQPVKETTVKEKILKLSLEPIAEGLMQRQNPKVVAEELLKTLEKVNISRQTVIDQFKWADVEAIAKQYGLPEMANPWLKEFHEAISAPVTAAPDGRTPSPPSQPGPSPENNGVEHKRGAKGQ